MQVLLSSDETLQLSGVQCVAEVLSHHPQYGQALLQADIAGQLVVIDIVHQCVCALSILVFSHYTCT